MENVVSMSLSQYNALEEARQLLSDTDFIKKLRRLMSILEAAKSPDEFENWYLGNDFKDLQKSAFNTMWSEEDKIWDHV